MTIIKPPKLEKGGTIGFLAVSGKIKNIENILRAKKFFEENGYKVVLSDTCYTSHRYLAGKSDEDCVKALHDFFGDTSINAILCARGGFGTLRLINKIDWNIIRNNPKIFSGYSDITILSAMMYKNAGLITFHSPMAKGDFGEEIDEYTKNSFFNTLSGEAFCFNSVNNTVCNGGEAKGTLWGGNLSSLVSLCGTDFIPDENLILFLEDLNEPVYKIDKMLTQLFNIDKIRKNTKGIVLGKFTGIEDKDLLKELFTEVANTYNIPCGGEFRITHEKIKDTLPFGTQCMFNSNSGTVKITESYTCLNF